VKYECLNVFNSVFKYILLDLCDISLSLFIVFA